MAYATVAELKAVFGSERLRRMIPDLQAEQLDTTLGIHLGAASAEVDSRLAAVYTTPIVTTDASSLAILRDVTIALTLRRMSLGLAELPKAAGEALKAADAWLERVASRKARLPNVASKARPVMQAYVDDSDDVGSALDPAQWQALLVL